MKLSFQGFVKLSWSPAPSSTPLISLSEREKSPGTTLELAGGYARDADKEAVYVLKANGFTFNIKKGEAD